MTHYATLGVPRDAAASVIKAAYRSLAQSSHPDKHTTDPDATAAFQRIQKAYETLGDAARRAHYDATGDELPPEPTLDDRAMQAISEVMGQALKSCDPVFDNVLVDAERRLLEVMEPMKAQRKQMTAGRDKIARAIERTKARAGNVDSLQMVLQYLDNQIAEPLKKVTDCIEEGERALEILRGHEYTVDARPAAPQPSSYDRDFQNAFMHSLHGRPPGFGGF